MADSSSITQQREVLRGVEPVSRNNSSRRINDDKEDQQNQQQQPERKRRSGFMNLMNFMTKYNFSRRDQKRKAVFDLGDSVTAADIVRLEKQVRSQNENKTIELIESFITKCRYIIAIAMWIILGSIFYAYHDDMEWSLGVYQSLSIGFSMGWNLPPDVVANHDSNYRTFISKFFTFLHNIIGVMFAGLAVIYIANDLLNQKKDWILQSDATKKIEEKSKRSWLWGNVVAYFTYHLPKIRFLIVFLIVAIGGTLWSYYSFQHTDDWTFPSACAFSFSTLSSAGYRTIPDSAESFQFIICAVYAAIGVPLMTISLGLFIGRLFFDHDNVTLFEKMAEDVTPQEIETMRIFCNKQEENQIDNLEFSILIALRIGAVTPEMIEMIKARFEVLDRNHEHRLAYDDIVVGDDGNYARRRFSRANSLLKSSFSMRQLLNLKSTSMPLPTQSPSQHKLLVEDKRASSNDSFDGGGKNKVHPDSSPGPRPRGLSFEQDGIALSRLRSYSGNGSFGYVQTRVRTDSGDETFSAWVKSSPEIMGRNSGIRKISIGGISEGSSEDGSSALSVRRCRVDSVNVEDIANKSASSPRVSFRESFTLSEEEALQLTKRDSGIKWVRNSPRSSIRKSIVLSEEEAMKLTANEGEEIRWIRNSPCQTRLQDKQVLPVDDIRYFGRKDSDVKGSDNIIARRRPSKTRKQSISFPVGIPMNSHGDPMSMKIDSNVDSKDNNDTVLESRKQTFQSRSGRTSVVGKIAISRSPTILDVVRGDESFKSFIHNRTSIQGMGFRERSEQINIMKMEKVSEYVLLIIYDTLTSISQARLNYVRSMSRKESFIEEFSFYACAIFYDPHVQFLALWLTWLCCGAVIFIITYKTKGDQNYVLRGFYETVNVGYGLYLTTPEFGESGYAFTTIHLMLGSVMISGAMAEFARYLNKVNDNDNLKAINIKMNESLGENKVGVEELGSNSQKQNMFSVKNIISSLRRCWKQYPIHFLFTLWLLIMTLHVSIHHNKTFFDALIFSTSILSTGGFISLPEDATTVDYFIVALFATAGVPLMALSLGMFTHYISRLGEQSALADLINAGISPQELSEMEDLEILDDDGHVDLSEYIVLILLRIGALKPELVKLTNVRFDQLQEFQQNDSNPTPSQKSNLVSVHAMRRETTMNHNVEQKKFQREASNLYP